ncbi:GntR family transcriptional regulator (plasmid) [Skermanella rosea]|nr:GntR family transcriptional regulator [Skermanella rosea]
MGNDGDGSRQIGNQVFARLRKLILELDLVPGERVSERDLQALVGASRTPIREALLRLEREGLVVREHRGYRVAPISERELASVYEWREIVESQAVRLACARALPEQLDAIQATIDRGLHDAAPETWFRIGSDVHVMLAGLSGNPFLIRAVEDIMLRIDRARWLLASTPEGRDTAHREHSRIVTLIRAGDAEAAVQAIAAHVRSGRDAVLAAFETEIRKSRLRGSVLGGARERLVT